MGSRLKNQARGQRPAAANVASQYSVELWAFAPSTVAVMICGGTCSLPGNCATRRQMRSPVRAGSLSLRPTSCSRPLSPQPQVAQPPFCATARRDPLDFLNTRIVGGRAKDGWAALELAVAWESSGNWAVSRKASLRLSVFLVASFLTPTVVGFAKVWGLGCIWSRWPSFCWAASKRPPSGLRRSQRVVIVVERARRDNNTEAGLAA